MQTTMNVESDVAARMVPLAEAAGISETGGKASRLAALIAAGEQVPDGFVLIGTGEAAVKLALDGYLRMEPGPVAVAVRSSASAEDGSDASFAGQFETVLNVVGAQDLTEALGACWDSVSSRRVSAYVERRGLEGQAAAMTMAVVVQRMVPARVAGVAFSADPLSGARNVVVIHAVPGLGDALVSGEVSPDRYRVTSGDDITSELANPNGPSLTTDEVLQIAAMVRRIAKADGTPQDTEWAIDSNGLWLLQARPMTALPPEANWESPIPGAKWLKDVQAGEWQTEPPSPLGATTTFEAMAVAREDYRGWPPIPKAFKPGHLYINGWLYMRVGGPIRTLVANILGAMVTLVTVGIDGHRRADRRWRPRLAELDELAMADPAQMDSTALRRHVDRLLDALGWWWIEISFFASLVRVGQQLIGSVPGLHDPGALFRGNDSLLLESERALRRAAADPNELPGYIARFGHTVESADPIHPTLAESPEALRWQLAAARADREGPDRRLARLRAERAQAELSVAAVSGPRGYFVRRCVATGQSHAAHTDDAVFHFQRVLALVRAAFLAQGRRLAEAGVLETADDVFYLDLAEIWSAVNDQHGLVERRRTEREGRKRLSPPPMIPPAGDPDWANDRVMKALPAETRAMLLERGLKVRDGRRVVVGTPASPGIAKGIARLINGPEDFGRFQAGEILVAHATSPIWTPLLAIASAAVTEVGGPFSHAAIVAREFGIPLVDGALDATTAISDGAPVTVNGSMGFVEL